VVRLIPETGRRVLCVNPEFTTRFRWAPGSIAMWDNRQTSHFAVNDYQGQRRVMHRILLAGSKPVPAS
jgi:taurine dioxygenase